MSDFIEETVPENRYDSDFYDAARAESDLAFIAKKRREIEWWQHNIAAAGEKIVRAEQRLKDFAIAYRQTVGGSQISLRNGFISLSKMREHTVIYDRPAFNKWTESREWPDEAYDKKPNESKIKNFLTITEDGSFVFVGSTAVVPGIRRVIPGPLDFNVKINAGRTHTEEKDDAEPDAE